MSTEQTMLLAPAPASGGNEDAEAAPAEESSRLGSIVVDSVIALIHDRRLGVGDVLPSEGQFAQQLGVGRSVVREAFKALEALGIVELSAGRRARVSALKHQVLGLLMDHAVTTMQVSVHQTLDLRRLLEVRTAGLAALRRSDDELAQIRAAAVAMRQRGVGPEAPVEDDIAFHVAIARASRNPLYAMFVESFGLVMRQTCPVSWAARRSEDDKRGIHDMHDDIVVAIEARDAVTAEAAMAAHFDKSVRAMIAAGIA